ncbi:MAG TPA: ABC transporter permease, partial [Gemmatimonadaceae bacterium]|nr:ABC transporter permease [Gemmatimonadaceae bacterium]
MPWYRRMTNAVAQERAARDIERETAFHIAELVEELMSTGMPEADARAEAHRRFGNPPRLNERTRDADLTRWLDSLVADVKYAARALRRSPGFTAVAILSLALGIGANTAIFTVTNALALRSLPVADPASLVQVTMGKNGEDFTNPLWEQVRAESTVFAGTLTFSSTQFVLSQGGEERRTAGHWVSGGFFTVLGVRAEAGRTLLPSDDARGCAPVLAVGDAFARREFGSPEAALGRTVPISGHPFPVVGVIDPSFTGLDVGRAADIYVPLCALPIVTGNPQILDQRSRWYLQIVGRRKPGVTDAQVNARLATISRGVFEATVPANWGDNDQKEYRTNALTSVPAGGGLSDLRTTYRSALFTLMVIVGVVLLIACTNLAQLLLARAAARQREIAIRLAIGVGRARLVRQLLTESLLLSLGGAALGILFASWASRTLVSFISNAARPIWLDLSLDWTVLG